MRWSWAGIRLLWHIAHTHCWASAQKSSGAGMVTADSGKAVTKPLPVAAVCHLCDAREAVTQLVPG